ncbi:glycerophosphodiester phosphodiesterase GDPDL3-like [Silene latifolia]|uniref:glycerophosphodiester phosphodiesterase GDPDL3-like n=1 Tax=Silene latifolia TaxID=37657 RepID=UPI003D770C28
MASNFVTVTLGVLLLQLFTLTCAQKSTSKWLTLDGSAPLVIARGGLSGMFPDSSYLAYNATMMNSVPDVVLWCDVQLTKDGAGICFPSLMLDNASTVTYVYPKNRMSRYNVDGNLIQAYFPSDFSLKELASVALTQGFLSRPPYFDDEFSILTVEDVYTQNKPAGFWLNIQHDAFYIQRKLSMRNFVISTSKKVIISHISSPDISFLQGLAKPFAATKTKMVFRFLDKGMKEPSTNQTYDSLRKNLTFIKSFASGILVPRNYIWPVDATGYLQPHTSLVVDAHNIGIEVFAADFANDNIIAYNYSYSPVAEYLSFIDNGDFSVDGMLSDFSVTASEARDCFAHVSSNASAPAKPLVISHYGASGDYPGCTDISYTAAISDGADVIDCPVQMSKDNVPFCLSSINLIDSTLVTQTQFRSMLSVVTEIQPTAGIFSFKLDWADIQGLTPVIANPYVQSSLYRNPKFKNAGKLISLSEFLALAKNASSLAAILLKIEHAEYLAVNQSMSVVDAVTTALEKAGYNSPKAKKVMIKTPESAVLKALKGKKYERIYEVDNFIRDASNATIADLKTFSDSVVVNQESVYQTNQGFLVDLSNVVQHLHSFKLPVYVQVLKNELVDISYDFFSEPIAEMNSYVMGAKVDGIITEFPQTGAAYKKNLCLTMKNTPTFMRPVQPGQLISLGVPELMPPAEAPHPILTVANISEAPLPLVMQNASSPTATIPETPKTSPNGQHQITASALLSCLAIIVAVCQLL